MTSNNQALAKSGGQNNPGSLEDHRKNRLWRLYCSRISSIDPIRDVRGIEKICSDEFKVAEAALRVFEDKISGDGRK